VGAITTTYTETFDFGTDYTDWTAWQRTDLGPGRWKKCRSRTVTHRWESRKVTVTRYDGTGCPPGYISIGANTCEATGGEPEPGMPKIIYTWPSTSTSYGDWEPHSESWSETQCDHFSIWLTLDAARIAANPPGIYPRDLRMHKLKGMELVAGDRLVCRGPKEMDSVLVDGEVIDPRRTIDTSTLAPGAHTIDLRGTHDDAKIQMQFVLNVVSALAFVDGERQRGKTTTVRVRNQSHNPALVALDIVGSPVGWRGFVARDAVRLIPAGKTAAFHVGALAVDPIPETTDEPLPIEVQATALGDKRSAPRETTVSVSPSVK
jgi:hypothetical protein